VLAQAPGPYDYTERTQLFPGDELRPLFHSFSAWADFAGLALAFAEAAGCHAAWKQTLKEWNMIQSQQVLEWQAEARAEGTLDVLEAKFGGVSEEVASAVRATTDMARLKNWTVLAAKAPSLEQFRHDAQL
jgi:hypothetical protein